MVHLHEIVCFTMVPATFGVDFARNRWFYNDFVEINTPITPKAELPRCCKSEVGGLGSAETIVKRMVS